MQQLDETEFKAEIDRISKRIESILKRVAEIAPGKDEENQKGEPNQG